MSDWQTLVLSEAIDVKHGFAFPGAGFGIDANTPQVLTPGNFAIHGGFQKAKPKSFSGEFPAEFLLAPGEVVVTMTDLSKSGDTLGFAAKLPPGNEYLHNQRIGLVQLTDPQRLNLDFFHYLTRIGAYRRHILGTASGSTVKHTSPGRIRAFATPVPPLLEQQAIAEVLGALDDKIAANTAVAVTADALMRAEYAGFGNARRVRIGEVALSPRKGVDPTTIDPSVAYVGLEHIPRRRMWLDEVGVASDVTSGKSGFERGDILFGKLRPYFHKVAVATASGICSTDVLVVRADEPATESVLLAAISSDEVLETVVAASEGTRMPRTSWKDLASTEIHWPEDDQISAVAARLDAICAATSAALDENRTLAATRDALLPQLMSGKLRVRDAEAAASAAGA